ncbi:hypothetical protein EG68_05095 [Paragonimus skrjabini miyazakii]|uniref:Nicotinamide riboside kinase 1 n=1 Tax=Paragonimus skrjabini miyazakii TaxID=59628 RepID=A0A8S9Z2A5_9TREM|nr:hypothetical protein EG68_05095 [Paragonimus skrjabini miyazakii]
MMHQPCDYKASSLIKQTIIGIGGASCAGKTLLCKGLQSTFTACGFQPKVLSMDDYYWKINDPRHIRDPITGHPNLDCNALRQLMDLRIFLTLDYETMIARRKLRDYDPADPPGYFDQYVWPSYTKIVNNLSKIDENIVFVDASTISPSELLDQVIEKTVIHEGA